MTITIHKEESREANANGGRDRENMSAKRKEERGESLRTNEETGRGREEKTDLLMEIRLHEKAHSSHRTFIVL